MKAADDWSTGLRRRRSTTCSVIPAALTRPPTSARSGCPDIASIWQLAGDHTKTPVGPETLLYRVQFRFVASEVTGRDH